jgi:hypothetical protein
MVDYHLDSGRIVFDRASIVIKLIEEQYKGENKRLKKQGKEEDKERKKAQKEEERGQRSIR